MLSFWTTVRARLLYWISTLLWLWIYLLLPLLHWTESLLLLGWISLLLLGWISLLLLLENLTLRCSWLSRNFGGLWAEFVVRVYQLLLSSLLWSDTIAVANRGALLSLLVPTLSLFALSSLALSPLALPLLSPLGLPFLFPLFLAPSLTLFPRRLSIPPFLPRRHLLRLVFPDTLRLFPFLLTLSRPSPFPSAPRSLLILLLCTFSK